MIPSAGIAGRLLAGRVYLLFALLVLWVTLFGDGAWSAANLRNLAIAVSIEGIMVVGMTVVMIGGGFDLSIGSVMALAGVVAMAAMPLGIPAAVAVGLAAAALCGLANGLLVALLRVNPFIATLGTMIAVRGLVMTYTNAQPVVGTDLGFMWLGRGRLAGIPVPALLFLAAALLGYLFLAHLRSGRAVYALGGNEAAARASGVPTARIKIAGYVLCSLCAGLAGIVLAARLNTGSPIIGEQAALNVITAVLLGGVSLSGGVGSMQGSFAGLMCVGVLANALNLFDVPAYWQRICQGLLLLALVVLDRLAQAGDGRMAIDRPGDGRNVMKRRVFLMGAMLLGLSPLAAGGALAQDKIVIGLSQPNLGWPYIAAYTKKFQELAAQQPNVEVIALSGDGDIAKQAKDMDTLIAKKVDIILVCSLDGNAIVPSIQAAHEAGIPVLAVSNEPAAAAAELLAGYSGPDDYVQGVIAAELMHEALGGKGNVVIIEGTPGQSTTAARNKGFEDGLAQLKSEIKVLSRQTANWDPVRAKAVTEDFMTAHGDQINGLFSHDDNTAAASAEAIKAAGKLAQIKVVGTGGSKNGIQAIRDGLVYGTMNQAPSADAEQGLRLALDIVAGKAPPEKRNIIPMPKITAANANDFEGEW